MYSVKQHLSTRLARHFVGALLLALLAPLVHAQQILFDDFSYSNSAQFTSGANSGKCKIPATINARKQSTTILGQGTTATQSKNCHQSLLKLVSGL